MSLSPTQFGGAEGNEYTAPNGRTYTMRTAQNGAGVEALTPGGRSAGRMVHGGPYTSEPEQNTIGNINVSTQHRGKGVATAMLDYARKDYPDLHHSRILSDEGYQFATSSPREWQPKLPLEPETRFSNGPNGGEPGPSPWSSYRDFGPMNKRTTDRYNAEAAERRRPKPPSQGEQGRLF